MKFEKESKRFTELCIENKVEFLLVGGAAVNFYGYKRHSSDIDFWVKPNKENFARILVVLQNLGYSTHRLPKEVIEGKRNISIKISPEQEIEIIISFNPNKTFDEAFAKAEEMKLGRKSIKKMKVISVMT